jgi:hypothetical protein
MVHLSTSLRAKVLIHYAPLPTRNNIFYRDVIKCRHTLPLLQRLGTLYFDENQYYTVLPYLSKYNTVRVHLISTWGENALV